MVDLFEQQKLEQQKLEQQLAKKQQALDTITAEYHEFMYIVSHDLSAPIRSIEGFSHIIANEHQESFDERTQHHFNRIIQSTEKMKVLLSALLDYARLHTSSNQIRPCDLNSIAQDTCQQLSPMIQSSNAHIQIDQLPSLIADPQQIQLVFYHLLHNALLYHLPGNTPKIQITAEQQGNHWLFCMSDNGIGIQENLTDQVFQVFRRGVSDKKYTGIGMGLALVKKILRQHQGDVWIESTRGQGSRLYFTINLLCT